MKNLIFLSVAISVASSVVFTAARAAQAPVDNIQLNCKLENKSADIIIGNKTQITDMSSEALVYMNQGGQFVLTQHTPATLVFQLEKPSVGKLTVQSQNLSLEVSVFVHPLMWNAGTVNGAPAKCVIDSEFYQSLKF